MQRETSVYHDQSQQCKKDEKSFHDTLAVALNDFYENRVRLGLERKGICEEIAQSVSDKIFKKIETADSRFEGKRVVRQGIRYDGLQAEEPVHLDMMVQLSFGESSAVFFKTTKDGVNIQPDSSTVWKDCLSRNGYLSADKVNKLLHYYVAKSVNILNHYMKEGLIEKLPKKLRSVVMKDGREIMLVVNKNITVSFLPAFVLPDSRINPGRQDCPSSSHVVCRPTYRDSTWNIVWKWSHFVAEKNRIRSLAAPSCRVQLLRILTEIRDTDDNLRILSSYHLKHVLFHVNHSMNDLKEWTGANISPRFMDLLQSLLGFLRKGFLPHYFMQPPDFDPVNLLENLDNNCIQEISKSVEKIIQDPLQSLICDPAVERKTLWPWELELFSP